ncbi:hypothetical protein VKT23_005049 [Stygiomarasmius scandens]|uniref:CENP-V/GFA domain-containing protein n=1 Tax=Marasmiellus scandens TaxID=2682957 RepID=A0ABR1JWI0_9AGAR
MSANVDEVRTGSCLCEKNKFTVKGNPLFYVLCHCSNCKRSTGSAFMANVVFEDENVDLTNAKHLGAYSDSGTKSGSTIIRHFCTNCGSTMFVRPDKNKLAGAWIIPAPLIDKFEAWTPEKEVFPESKCAFVKALETSAPKPVDQYDW